MKRAKRALIRNANAKRRRSGQKSSLEWIVKGWLLGHAIEHKEEYRVSQCHADFYLPATNTLVEVNGCHWHAQHCQGAPTKKEVGIKLRDARRYKFFANKGYKVLILWDCEIEGDAERALAKLLDAAGRY